MMHTPVISALRRQRQKDMKFKCQPRLHKETCLKTNKNPTAPPFSGGWVRCPALSSIPSAVPQAGSSLSFFWSLLYSLHNDYPERKHVFQYQHLYLRKYSVHHWHSVTNFGLLMVFPAWASEVRFQCFRSFQSLWPLKWSHSCRLRLNFPSRVLLSAQHFLHDVSCSALEKSAKELMKLGDFEESRKLRKMNMRSKIVVC